MHFTQSMPRRFITRREPSGALPATYPLLSRICFSFPSISVLNDGERRCFPSLVIKEKTFTTEAVYKLKPLSRHMRNFITYHLSLYCGCVDTGYTISFNTRKRLDKVVRFHINLSFLCMERCLRLFCNQIFESTVLRYI